MENGLLMTSIKIQSIDYVINGLSQLQNEISTKIKIIEPSSNLPNHHPLLTLSQFCIFLKSKIQNENVKKIISSTG